jgi:glucans biosynthesis protein C
MTAAAIPARRYDLDWLRIIAFGLLILYHVGMFYVTWDWHVKSSRASDTIEPLMGFLNPWRLTLLFLISGAATRFMADKMSAWKLTGARMGRLFPPLLLAVFVIVPPQTYFQILEVLERMHLPRSPYLDNFWVKYATGSGHWCSAPGECLTTPTYNHMWFVAYLIIYTLVLILLLPLLRRIPSAVGKLIAGPFFILTPWLFMFALRVTLFPVFDETHAIFNDWYLHALYLPVFLFGFAIAKHEPFFQSAMRWRGFALAATVASWIAVQSYYQLAGDTPPDWLRNIFRGVHELQAWTAIVAAIGFAHRYLKNADGPVRRTLTHAIFPFYLAHQTVIVVAGHYLDALQWPLWIEAPVLITTTALGCWTTYELGRRIPLLRVWVGLPSKGVDFRGKNMELAPGGTG